MAGFISDSEFKPDAPTEAAPSAGFIPDEKFTPDQAGASSNEQQANALEAQEQQQEEKSGGLGNEVLSGLSSAAKTINPPYEGPNSSITVHGNKISLLPEPMISPERARELEEANPISSMIGTGLGLLTPGGIGKALEQAGTKVATKFLGEPLVEEGILAGAKRSAVKLAAENALYQTADESAKMMRNDPNQSAQSALTNIGLAGVIGGVAGSGFGAISPLWKASIGDKAGQLAEDFKGRMKEHLNNPDRAGTLTDELNQYHQGVKSAADEVYGPAGLKAQEISKLMPEEITPKITNQVEELNNNIESTLKDMHAKGVPERYMNKYISEANKFQEMATKPGATPEQIFNATQDFKQTLQGYSKGNFGPFAVPSYHEAYDFLNATKGLAKTMREGLEDPAVWGKAAQRQQAINKAFSEYLPSLKDFEKKFTSEVNGERVVDPGKVNTYMNQLGKPSAELKQSMLQNFMDASEKYKKVISDTHSNLGIDSPIQPTSTNMIHNTLKEQTHGAKLADIFVKRFGDLGGKTLGGMIGGTAGHMTGIPGGGMVGAILGEHTLGHFLGSILPAIAKPMLEKIGSGQGLKAAAEYGLNVAKGQKLSDGAIKSLFKSGLKTLPDSKMPTKEDRKKLDVALQKLQQDPEKLVNASGQVGHYLPDHATAIGSLTQNAVNFLNSIKPSSAPRAPLDPSIPVSPAIEAQYDRALDIAQQPLVVVQAIKEGTLNSNDIKAIQALYPDLYKGLQQKMMNAIVEHKSEDGIIPYNRRMSMSLFMGQPLDSTMSPQAIMAAQPPPPQPPQQAPQGKKPSQAASNNMLKGSKSMQTAVQASEAMHSSGAKA